MKKILLFAAAILALVSCAKTEPKLSSDQGLVVLNTPLVGKTATKTTELTGANFPNTETFDAVALFSASSVTDLATIKAGASTTDFYSGWKEYSYLGATSGFVNSTVFWPKGAGYLTFWAVSPHGVDATVNWTAGTLSKADWTIASGNYQSDKDLLFSDISAGWTKGFADDNNSAHPFNEYDGVDILFHHALALAEFRIAKSSTKVNSGETIYVSSIKIQAASTKTLNEKGSVVVTAPKTYQEDAAGTKFTAGDANVAWTPSSSSVVVYNLVGSDTEVTQSAASAAAITSAAKIGNAQLLIPQTTNTNIDLVIGIKSKFGDITSSAETPYTIRLTTQHDGAWKWGKKYIYKILIEEDQVVLDPDVVDWESPIDVEDTI